MALAVLLAVLPLLPAGPRYLGLGPSNAIDAAIVALVIVWLAARVEHRHRAGNAGADNSFVIDAWAVFLVATTGAALVGLAAENRIGSLVFAAHAQHPVTGVLRPIELTSAPFYSARVWLTFVEGFVAFAAIRDCALLAPDRWRFVKTASWGWLTGLAAVSLLAIAQYATRFQLDPRSMESNPALVRASATLDDPNALGAYLLLSIGLAIGVAFSEDRPGPRRMAIGVGVLACVALLTTVSRIAYAGLFLTTLVIVGFIPTGRGPIGDDGWFVVLRKGARWCLGGLVVLTGLWIVAKLGVDERATPKPTTPIEALWQTVDPRVPLDEVFKNRLAYWSAAFAMTRQHPFTGVGLGRYPRLLPEFRSRWLELENVHSFFLQVLVEAGVLGAAAIVATFALAIAALVRGVRLNDRRRAGYALGGVFGVVGFSTTLLTGHPLLVPSGQILWASALALWLVGSPSGSPAVHLRSRRGRLAVLLASLVAGSAYVAAARRMPSPPLDGAVWGYSWGLFQEEWGFFPEGWGLPLEPDPTESGERSTRAARFRWSGARALLELRIPADATECTFKFAALLPSRGVSQFVRVSYGDQVQLFEVRTSDVNSVRVAVPPALLDDQRRLVVHVAVAPSFVPARLGLSPDSRQLGVQLFPPRCARGS